jgi:hypothetical protein
LDAALHRIVINGRHRSQACIEDARATMSSEHLAVQLNGYAQPVRLRAQPVGRRKHASCRSWPYEAGALPPPFAGSYSRLLPRLSRICRNPLAQGGNCERPDATACGEPAPQTGGGRV